MAAATTAPAQTTDHCPLSANITVEQQVPLPTHGLILEALAYDVDRYRARAPVTVLS